MKAKIKNLAGWNLPRFFFFACSIVFAMPAFSRRFAVVVTLTADYGSNYGKPITIIIIVKYIIFHAFDSSGPLVCCRVFSIGLNKTKSCWSETSTFCTASVWIFFRGTFVPSYPEVTEVSLFSTPNGSPCLRNLGKFALNQGRIDLS